MGKAEAHVEEYLLEKCKNKGWLCYKMESIATRGFPDRLVIGNGQTIFVETKSPVGQPSSVQKHRIKEMLTHGADVRLIRHRAAVDELIAFIDGCVPDENTHARMTRATKDNSQRKIFDLRK